MARAGSNTSQQDPAGQGRQARRLAVEGDLDEEARLLGEKEEDALPRREPRARQVAHVPAEHRRCVEEVGDRSGGEVERDDADGPLLLRISGGATEVSQPEISSGCDGCATVRRVSG